MVEALQFFSLHESLRVIHYTVARFTLLILKAMVAHEIQNNLVNILCFAKIL